MALTPSAVTHASVLRHLAAHPGATDAEIAEATGKLAHNVKRDFPKLEDFVDLQTRSLTDGGRAAVAALDRADGKGGEGGLAGFIALTHREIAADPDQPRKHFDEEDLQELAGSLVLDGLVEPLVVRPDRGRTLSTGAGEPLRPHILVAGERRWRAIRIAQDDGRLPYDWPIPCHVKDVDAATVKRLALIENLQRKDLKPLEEARAIQGYIDLTGEGTGEIATALSRTQRFVQRRLQLLELPDDKQKALEAGKLTLEEAWRWLANRPAAPNLPARSWLIALELLDALQAAEAGKTEGEVEVGSGAEDDADFAALSAGSLYMVSGPHDTREEGYKTGRRHVRLTYYAAGPLKLRFGDEILTSKAELISALYAIRDEAGLPTTYQVPWLKGPFTADATVVAEEAERRREDEAQRVRVAAAQASSRDRMQAAAAKTEALLLQNRSEADHRPPAAAFVEAAAELGQDLPWTLQRDGDVMTASGKCALRSQYSGDAPIEVMARNRLIVTAVNAAGGVATPDPEAAPAEDQPICRAAFVDLIAGVLEEDCEDLPEDDDEARAREATARAERGLDAFLADEGIEYGAPDYDWEDEGAQGIAQGIREDGLGQMAEEQPAPFRGVVGWRNVKTGKTSDAEGHPGAGWEPIHGEVPGVVSDDQDAPDDDAEPAPGLVALVTGKAAPIAGEEAEA